MTRGGKRPNAGRKVGYRKPGARRHQLAIRLDDAEKAKALAIGGGNASEGLRIALHRARIDVRTEGES